MATKMSRPGRCLRKWIDPVPVANAMLVFEHLRVFYGIGMLWSDNENSGTDMYAAEITAPDHLADLCVFQLRGESGSRNVRVIGRGGDLRVIIQARVEFHEGKLIDSKAALQWMCVVWEVNAGTGDVQLGTALSVGVGLWGLHVRAIKATLCEWMDAEGGGGWLSVRLRAWAREETVVPATRTETQILVDEKLQSMPAGRVLSSLAVII